MTSSIPEIEFPEFATHRLFENVELARDATALRVGYDVELERLEPVERNGHSHVRIYWRRKIVISVPHEQ